VTTLRGSWRAGPVAALRTRAEAWLLDPPSASVESRLERGGAGDPEVAIPAPEPPIVAVVGLGPRVGGTTVARALAGRLAGSDPAGAAIVFAVAAPPRPALATIAAARLAEQVRDLGCDGACAVGRLVLVPPSEPLAAVAAERPAPIVVDIGHGEVSEPALAVADHATLIASPEVETALVETVERSLRAAGLGVSLVVNRSVNEGLDRRAVLIAESRLAAATALACRGPRGVFSAPIAELAERCLAEART
jgi:hypothetical protein